MQTSKKINEQSLSDQIPVTYLWFGKSVPEDYLISLGELNFPVVFLKNPMLERNFSRQLLNIEKSDYYRLQHLYEYGGIYSDLDNIIDYPCLMKLLKPYQTQDKLIFMADSTGNMSRQKNKRMPNHLIYAPYPNMPILREMLNKIDQKKPRIWQFGRELFLGQFTEPIQLNMQKCVKHLGDWSWYQESNQVLNGSAKGRPQFRQKLRTKKQIIEQNAKLEKEIQQQKEKVVLISDKVTKSNKQKDKLLKEVLSQFKVKLSQKNAPLNQQNSGAGQQKTSQKEVLNIPNVEEVHKNAVNFQFKNSEWQNERSSLQNNIFRLEQQNQNLQFTRNVGVNVLGGMLFFVVLVMIAMILTLKKSKGVSYSNPNSPGRYVTEQSKYSPQ